MDFSRRKMTEFLCLLLLVSSFISCGPVRFSSSSTQPTDNPPATDPTDTNQNNQPNQNNPPTTTQTRDVTTNFNVENKLSKVDIVLVIDNSSSMEVDNQKLADRLYSFTTQLESAAIDWQMCLAVSSSVPYTSGGANYTAWGISINWAGVTGATPWILTKGTTGLTTIFKNTFASKIGTGGANTNDERGIKSAYWHVNYSAYNKCYRTNSALAHIFISDEDERSIGGNAALQFYADELKPLEEDDLPSTLIDKVKSVLGANVRYRANSIIVKPNDSACLQSEDEQGTKSHYGIKYNELSTMSGGGIGSICDTDYLNSLNYFNEVINNALESIPLECNPVNNNVSVTITPTQQVTSTVQGQSLIFNPSVQAGSTIVAQYKCPVVTTNKLRQPNSLEELNFFARVYVWITEFVKNLF